MAWTGFPLRGNGRIRKQDRESNNLPGNPPSPEMGLRERYSHGYLLHTRYLRLIERLRHNAGPFSRRLGALIGHLDEHQISELLDAVAVAHAIIPLYMAIIPQFGHCCPSDSLSLRERAAINGVPFWVLLVSNRETPPKRPGSRSHRTSAKRRASRTWAQRLRQHRGQSAAQPPRPCPIRYSSHYGNA
jgi:hypothetical protein